MHLSPAWTKYCKPIKCGNSASICYYCSFTLVISFVSVLPEWLICFLIFLFVLSLQCVQITIFLKKNMSPLQIFTNKAPVYKWNLRKHSLDKITLDTLDYNGILFGCDVSSFIFIQLTKFLKFSFYSSQMLLSYLRSRIWNKLLNIYINLRYKQIGAHTFLASYFANYISEIFVENVSITLFKVNRMIAGILYLIFTIKTGFTEF